MPTRVYLSGTRVIVDKTGSTTLSIPQYRAKYQFFGVEPIDSLDDYTDIKFTDTITTSFIEDKLDKIQDSTGAFIGTNKQVLDYLSGFMYLSDSYITKIEPCTAANQETIIAQNEVIKSELKDIRTIDEESQDIIKKELKENNKYLRKIYQ